MPNSSGRIKRPSGRNTRKPSGAYKANSTTAQKNLRKAMREAGIRDKFWAQPMSSLLRNGEVNPEADFSQLFSNTVGSFRVSHRDYKNFTVELVTADDILAMKKRARKQLSNSR